MSPGTIAASWTTRVLPAPSLSVTVGRYSPSAAYRWLIVVPVGPRLGGRAVAPADGPGDLADRPVVGQAVWVMVPVRSTHETVKVPLGALRSGTSWVTEAAVPERWCCTASP